jgi:hypothetical protein
MPPDSALANDTPPASGGFSFVTDWQVADPASHEAVIGFWKRENAIGDAAEAHKRLAQLIAHALAPDGSVAAVCTAVAVTLPRLGQPMYYYRCFVGSGHRNTRLVSALLLHARDVLEAHARANGFPCIGVLVELENGRFGKALRAPVWRETGLVYIGRSGRGFDLRAYYFRGARLKAPPAS